MTGRSTSRRIAVAWLAATAALTGFDRPVAAQSPSAAVATPNVTAPAPRRVTHAGALAAGCTPCHQPQIRGIPALDEQTREALRAKLEAFREGTLAGTVMPQLV